MTPQKEHLKPQKNEATHNTCSLLYLDIQLELERAPHQDLFQS